MNRRKRIIIFLVSVMVLALIGCKSSDYKKAIELFEAQNYEEAQALFVQLGDYKDSAEKLEQCNTVIELQEQFVSAVEKLKTSSGDRTEAFKTAFSCYLNLPENALNQRMTDTLDLLIKEFNTAVDETAKQEMTLEFESEIAKLEEIAAVIPEELAGQIAGCEQVRTLRQKHLDLFIDQFSALADNVEAISKYVDELFLAEADALIDETIPLAQRLSTVSYTDKTSELNDQFGFVSLDEVISTLQGIKELIPQMCYTDCYAVRYEYILKYDKSYIESGSDSFWYGYVYQSSMKRDYAIYKDYLDKHFTLVKSNPSSNEYLYDVGVDKPLELDDLVLSGWDIYAVIVTPPYMAESDMNWGS